MKTNWNDLKRAWLYEMLVLVTWKKRNTIKQYFCNHKMDVTNPKHFITYWNKYGI